MPQTEPQAEAAPIAVEPRGVRLARLVGVHEAGRALRDFATYLPTKFLPAAAGFLALPIVARKLQPADLGVLAIAQTLVSFGWLGAGHWLTSTINRELPGAWTSGETEEFDRRLRGGLAVTALLFLGFLAVLGGGALGSQALARTFLLIAAASLGLITQNIAVTIFQGSLRPRAYMLVEVGARVVGLGTAVLLVFEGYGVRGYLGGVAGVSFAIGAIGLLAGWPGKVRGPVASWSDIHPWLTYGIPASLSSLAVWGLLFVDRYLLSLLRSTTDVGVYTLGSVLGDKPIEIPVLAFTIAAKPLLVNAFDGPGRMEAERLLAAYTRVIILITIPILTFLTVTREPFLGLLVGTSQRVHYYAEATKVVPIIALGSFIGALALLSNVGISLARKKLYMVYVALFGLGVNVVANLVLIPLYGIIGAAIATPLGMVAYLAGSQFVSRRYLTWHFPYSTLLRAIVAGAAGAMASIPVARAAGWMGIQSLHAELGVLGVTALLGGFVYVLVLGVLGEHRA